MTPFIVTYTEYRRQPGTYVSVSTPKSVVCGSLESACEYIQKHIIDNDSCFIADNILINGKKPNPSYFNYEGGTNGQ